jgi:hypothetical protein
MDVIHILPPTKSGGGSMPFPVKRWAAPVFLLTLAAPFAGSSDAAYHAVERVTNTLMSAAAGITVFERKVRDATARTPAPRVRVAQSGDDWIETLRNGSYWKQSRDTRRGSRSARREKRNREQRSREVRSREEERQTARSSSGSRTADRPLSSSGTYSVTKVVIAAHTASLPRRGSGEAYRTVCVRMCDGYYWPISFATDSADLARDSAKCEQSCSMPAKLYYAPMLGEASELVDLDGQPYTRLGTAFQFRVRYNPSCKCRAHPWETDAQERHKTYAVTEGTAVVEELGSTSAAAQAPAAGPASNDASAKQN